MRKRIVLALVLILALLTASSCSLIVKDEEVDRQTPIIEVLGKTFTKGEVLEQTEAALDYYEYLYYYYGMEFDRAAEDNIALARQEAIDMLIRDAVASQKMTEKGFDQFTAEELADIQTAAEITYQSYEDMIRSSFFADSELTGEALDAAVREELIGMGYPTLEEVAEQEKITRAQDRLMADIVKDVTVTEEEIAAEYAVRMENDKAEFTAYPDVYGSTVLDGGVAYYTPAGYRYVKHILVAYSEENQMLMNELSSEIAMKQSELLTAETSLGEMGEDAGADTEEMAANRAALTAAIETLTAEIATLELDLHTAIEAANAAIQPTVDEVLSKLAEGESFETLIGQYSQDPGMPSEGYLVSEASTNWVTAFRDGAMALKAVGDVSEPVYSDYGVHIIQYAGDAAEGEIGLENVREHIADELLMTKQDEAYAITMEQWAQEAGAKVYMDRL